MANSAALYKRFWRISTAADPPSTTPETKPDWNTDITGNGWVDYPEGGDNNLNYLIPHIAPTISSGIRSAKTVTPVAGRQDPALGQLAAPLMVETWDRTGIIHMGPPVRTPTAGAAALASTAWLSIATLDTQPGPTEQLSFTIASSTDATGAILSIIQDAVTVETIVIPDSVSSVDGVYYSKKGYDGTTDAITFTVAGTITAGTVTIAGILSTSSVFTYKDTATDGWIE